MSEWIRVESKDDIGFCEGTETVDVWIETNDHGNRYLEIPINYLVEVLGDFLRAAKS